MLTNSTWTLSPPPRSEFPNVSPCSITSSTWDWSHPSSSAKLTKPGPATHTLPTISESGRASTIAWPIALGFIFMGRASFMAKLHEKSPFSAFCGLSIERSLTSTAGSLPDD